MRSDHLGFKKLTKANFPEFIGYSRKRINLTQMLLVDILGCDQSKITDEFLNHIVDLGQVIELKAVSLRDVHKAELNDSSSYNCYYNWLKISKCSPIYPLAGREGQSMNEKNKVEFLKYVDDLNSGKVNADTSKIINQIKFNLLLLNI